MEHHYIDTVTIDVNRCVCLITSSPLLSTPSFSLLLSPHRLTSPSPCRDPSPPSVVRTCLPHFGCRVPPLLPPGGLHLWNLCCPQCHPGTHAPHLPLLIFLHKPRSILPAETQWTLITLYALYIPLRCAYTAAYERHKVHILLMYSP